MAEKTQGRPAGGKERPPRSEPTEFNSNTQRVKKGERARNGTLKKHPCCASNKRKYRGGRGGSGFENQAKKFQIGLTKNKVGRQESQQTLGGEKKRGEEQMRFQDNANEQTPPGQEKTGNGGGSQVKVEATTERESQGFIRTRGGHCVRATKPLEKQEKGKTRTWTKKKGKREVMRTHEEG